MPKVKVNCEYCGKEVEKFPSDAKRFRFCSRRCQGLDLRMSHNIREIGAENKDHYGYIWVKNPEHPNAIRGWVKKHRMVMSDHLGRKLEDWEHVHHKDENKENNDISNLELTEMKEHFQVHKERLMKQWREAKPWEKRERDEKGRFK